jgi:hypothetical protein
LVDVTETQVRAVRLESSGCGVRSSSSANPAGQGNLGMDFRSQMALVGNQIYTVDSPQENIGPPNVYYYFLMV